MPESKEDASRLSTLVRRIQELERERDRLRDQLWKSKARPSRLVGIVMIAVGTISLVSATVYALTVLAFIGLGLTFWGALLLLIRPSGYLRAELVKSTAFSSVKALDQLLGQLGCSGKGIYLPSKNLQGTVVFVPSKNGKPSITNGNSAESVKGVTVIPPGLSLANLFEDELGVDITDTKLTTLQKKLTKLITEDLEIVKEFEMQLSEERVHFKFSQTSYADLCNELNNNTRICSTLGCPICSAMGCLLAGSAKRPVAFEEETVSQNGRIMETSFRILQET